MTIVDIATGEITEAPWADRIRSAMARSVEAIIETGRVLIECKASVAHGEFEDAVREAGMEPGTARKLISVAEWAHGLNRAHVPDLPPSWGTLYELSRVEPSALAAAIEAGDVRPPSDASATTSSVPHPLSRRVENAGKRRHDLTTGRNMEAGARRRRPAALAKDVERIGWAAEQLGIGTSTAYRLAERGELPGAFRVGASWRISVPAFRRAVHGGSGAMAVEADRTGTPE